jgi:predicted nucleotidyltransferase
MKIVGIVAEYNPFHNGHAYQIKRVQEILHPDGIVVIMSGPFVQRGYPAFIDKWTRADMALSSGVNLVLELPTYFSTASAEGFASGAVTSLAASGIITHLAFGAESEDIDKLKRIAALLVDHEQNAHPVFENALKTELDRGLSFPRARENALRKVYDGPLPFPDISTPNTILAIEYLKALIRTGASIEPLLIKRAGNGYHDSQSLDALASATAIRKAYFDADTAHPFDFSRYMPPAAAAVLKGATTHPVSVDAFSKILFAVLRRSTPEQLSRFRSVGEGLEFKIADAALRTGSYDALVATLKSKRYPQTRIQRMLLNILLNIEKDAFPGEPQYLRILGTDSVGKQLIRTIKRRSDLPVITNVNRISKALKQSELLQLDFRAQDLYALGQPEIPFRAGAEDRTRTIVIKDI